MFSFALTPQHVPGPRVCACVQGTLIFLCGGDEGLFERVKGSMEGEGVTMGKAAHYLGAVGTGSKMKLVVNMTMGTMMNSLVSETRDRHIVRIDAIRFLAKVCQLSSTSYRKTRTYK